MISNNEEECEALEELGTRLRACRKRRVDGYQNPHLSGGQPELNKIPFDRESEFPALI